MCPLFDRIYIDIMFDRIYIDRMFDRIYEGSPSTLLMFAIALEDSFNKEIRNTEVTVDSLFFSISAST